MNQMSLKTNYISESNVEGRITPIIIKLFNFLNTKKKEAKNKTELLNLIKNYLPYFGIPKEYGIYMLDLYTLNFRPDGDYSNLTEDNFIDPRKQSGKKTPNYKSDLYTKALLPFQGSNLRGYWKATIDGPIYIVESYGWYPVYIHKNGKWYEASERYSSSTSKQMYHSLPYTYDERLGSKVYLLTRDEMDMIERGRTHQEVMKRKMEKFKQFSPSLISNKIQTIKQQGFNPNIPNVSIKFKISSVEESDDSNIVTVDIYDVLKTREGVQIDTPENYLKGEIPNLTPELVEKKIESKLKSNLKDYLGSVFDNENEEQKIKFRFNHLKK
jgi:hypothetical protein